MRGHTQRFISRSPQVLEWRGLVPFTGHVCQSVLPSVRHGVGWERPLMRNPPLHPPRCGRLGWETMSSFRRAGVHCDSQERRAKLLEALLEKKEMYFQRERVWHTGPALTPPQGQGPAGIL